MAFDLPGHGDAKGPRGHLPSWVGLRDALVPAMFTVSQAMPDHPRALPRVLFGHSLGGALALDRALAHPHGLDALVLSSPALRSAPPPWWKAALAQVARVLAPSLAIPSGLPSDGISRDPEVLRVRDADPRAHSLISAGTWAGLLAARRRCMAAARTLAMPTLVLQGTADTLIDPQGARDFVAATPPGRAELRLVEGGYHELFNDLGRDALVRGLLAWLDARFPR